MIFLLSLCVCVCEGTEKLQRVNTHHQNIIPLLLSHSTWQLHEGFSSKYWIR